MLPATPLSIPVHANQLNAVDEVCTAALGCSQGDAISQLLLLVVSGLLAVVVIAVAVRIREARAAVSEERSRTATEHEAFSRFARRIARLEPSSPAFQLGPANGATAAVSASSPPDRALERVRTAYEESVLAMGHYEEEYDEPLAEHMGRELGEEVATAVAQSQHLTPSLQQELVQRAREAARDRERLMTSLDGELEALRAAEDELSALGDAVSEAGDRQLDGRTFPELADEWHRLGELESRLNRVANARQETLRDRTRDGRGDDAPSLNAYLYDGLESHYPVLSDTASLADRVQAIRRRVLLALTSRA